jgi:hypothetical protein
LSPFEQKPQVWAPAVPAYESAIATTAANQKTVLPAGISNVCFAAIIIRSSIWSDVVAAVLFKRELALSSAGKSLRFWLKPGFHL